jgi:hypothetical protein
MSITIPDISFKFDEALRQLPASVQGSNPDLQEAFSKVNDGWELVREFIVTYNDMRDTISGGSLSRGESLKDSNQSQKDAQDMLCKILIDCVIFIPNLESWIEKAKSPIEGLLHKNAGSITRDKHPTQAQIEDSQKIIQFGEDSVQYLKTLEETIHKIKDDCINVMLGLLEQQQRQGDLKILPEHFAALHNYIIKHTISERKRKSQELPKLKMLQTRLKKLETLPWMSVSIPSISGHLGAFEQTEHFYLFVPGCFSGLIKKLPKDPNTIQLFTKKESLSPDEFQSFVLLQASFTIAEIKLILNDTEKRALDKVSSFLEAITKVREHVANLQEKQKCISGPVDSFVYRETHKSLDQWLDHLSEYEAIWLTCSLQELIAANHEVFNDQRNVRYHNIKIPTPETVKDLQDSLQQIEDKILLISPKVNKLALDHGFNFNEQLKSTRDALNQKTDVTGEWAAWFVETGDNRFFGDFKNDVEGILALIPSKDIVENSVNFVLSYESDEKRREAVLVVKKVILGEWKSESEHPFEELKQKIATLFDFRVVSEEERKTLIHHFAEHLIEKYVYYSIKDINTTSFCLLDAQNKDLSKKWLEKHKHQALEALTYWEDILSKQLSLPRRDKNSKPTQYFNLNTVDCESADEAFSVICALSNRKLKGGENSFFETLKVKFRDYVQKQGSLAEHFKDYRYFIIRTLDFELINTYFTSVFDELVTRQIKNPTADGQDELNEFQTYFKNLHSDSKTFPSQELTNKLVEVLNEKVTENQLSPWSKELQDMIDNFGSLVFGNSVQLERLQKYHLCWLQWMLKDREFASQSSNCKEMEKISEREFNVDDVKLCLNLIDEFLNNATYEWYRNSTGLLVATKYLDALKDKCTNEKLQRQYHHLSELMDQLHRNVASLINNLKNVDEVVAEIKSQFIKMEGIVENNQLKAKHFIDSLYVLGERLTEKIKDHSLGLPEELFALWSVMYKLDNELKQIIESIILPLLANGEGVPTIPETEVTKQGIRLFVPEGREKLSIKPPKFKWLFPGAYLQHFLLENASEAVKNINTTLRLGQGTNQGAGNTYENVAAPARICRLLAAVNQFREHKIQIQKEQKKRMGGFLRPLRLFFARRTNENLKNWLNQVCEQEATLLTRSLVELKSAITRITINDGLKSVEEQVKTLRDCLKAISDEVHSSPEKEQLQAALKEKLQMEFNEAIEQIGTKLLCIENISSGIKQLQHHYPALTRPTAFFAEEMIKRLHRQEYATSEGLIYQLPKIEGVDYFFDKIKEYPLQDDERQAIDVVGNILLGKAYPDSDATLKGAIEPLFKYYDQQQKVIAQKNFLHTLMGTYVKSALKDIHCPAAQLLENYDNNNGTLFIRSWQEETCTNHRLELHQKTLINLLQKKCGEEGELKGNQVDGIKNHVNKIKALFKPIDNESPFNRLQKALSDYVMHYIEYCQEQNNPLNTCYVDLILFSGDESLIDKYGAALINHAFKSYDFSKIICQKELINKQNIQAKLVESLKKEKQWHHQFEFLITDGLQPNHLYEVLNHFVEVSRHEPHLFLSFLDRILAEHPHSEFQKLKHKYHLRLFQEMLKNPGFAADHQQLLALSDQRTLDEIYGLHLHDLKKQVNGILAQRIAHPQSDCFPLSSSVLDLMISYSQKIDFIDDNAIQYLENEASQHQQAKLWIDIFNNDFAQAKSELKGLKLQYYQNAEANDSAAKRILEKIIFNLRLFTYKVAVPVCPEEQRNQQRLARIKFILPLLEGVDGVKKLEAEISEWKNQLNYQFESKNHLELYDNFQRNLQTFDESLLNIIYMIYPEYKKTKSNSKETTKELESLHDQLKILNNNNHSLLNVITASFDLHELLDNMGKKGQQETVSDSACQIRKKNAKLVELAKNLPKKAQKIRELLMHEDGLGYFADMHQRPFKYDIECYGNTIVDYKKLKKSSEEEIKSSQGSFLKNKYIHAIARFNLGECRSALVDLKILESKGHITNKGLIYHQAIAKVHYGLKHEALKQLETVKSYVPALLLTAKVYLAFAKRTSQRLERKKSESNPVKFNKQVQRKDSYLSKANTACEDAIEIYKDFLKYLEKNGSTLRDDDELQYHQRRMGLEKISSLGLLINKLYSTRKELIELIEISEITEMEKQDKLNHLKHENDLKPLFDQIKLAFAKIYFHRGQEKFNIALFLAAIADFMEGLEILPKNDDSTIQLRIDLHRARAKVYIFMRGIIEVVEMEQDFLKIGCSRIRVVNSQQAQAILGNININLEVTTDSFIDNLEKPQEFRNNLKIINVCKLAIADYTKAVELSKQLPKYGQKYTDCCNECAKNYQVQGNAYEKLGQIYRDKNLSDSATKCFEYSKYCYNRGREFLPKEDHEKGFDNNGIIKFMNKFLFFKDTTIKPLTLQTDNKQYQIK